MKSRKKIIFNGVFLAVVFALTIYGVFHGEDLSSMMDAIHRADKRWLIPGIALVAFFIWGESIIIWYMMRSSGIQLKKRTCFLFSSVGFFFSCITPSASGGQPMQIYYMKKEKISIRFSGIKAAWKKLKDSFVYFASNMATTAFGALNTLLIGAFLPATEVAYWSVCMQLIGAVQTMYTPITEGVYPEMIKTKSWKFIKRLLMIFMPIVLAGSVFSVAVAPYVLLIVGGEQYVAATSLFRALVPVLIFSFPGIVLGWPTLGALDKAAQVTKTTILAAVVQVVSLLLLIATGHFTVMWIAIFRCVTEFVLMTCRGWYCWKYRKEFC